MFGSLCLTSPLSVPCQQKALCQQFRKEVHIRNLPSLFKKPKPDKDVLNTEALGLAALFSPENNALQERTAVLMDFMMTEDRSYVHKPGFPQPSSSWGSMALPNITVNTLFILTLTAPLTLMIKISFQSCASEYYTENPLINAHFFFIPW